MLVSEGDNVPFAIWGRIGSATVAIPGVPLTALGTYLTTGASVHAR